VDELIEVLQQERDRLEQLRFRYTALELLVQAREVRYWGWALQDLNRARIRVREVDLVRAAQVGVLDLPLTPGTATLRDIAAAAPAPWSGILRDHHDSLASLVADIELHAHAIAQAGREALAELARTGTLALPPLPTTLVRVLVGAGEAASAPLAADGSKARLRAPGSAEDLDPVSIECLLGDVIAAAGRLRTPALLAFLR
jgi:hypothetical protein